MAQVTLTGGSKKRGNGMFGVGVPGPKKATSVFHKGGERGGGGGAGGLSCGGAPERCPSHYNLPTSERPAWEKG